MDEKNKILLMEDDSIIRLSVSQQLRDMQYAVDEAKNGETAIELYRKAMKESKPIDIVIMDLTIVGGMGGMETIEKLIEIDPNVNAIIASGYSDDTFMDDFKKYGFKGAVYKPYEVDELDELLQKVMERKNE